MSVTEGKGRLDTPSPHMLVSHHLRLEEGVIFDFAGCRDTY